MSKYSGFFVSIENSGLGFFCGTGGSPTQTELIANELNSKKSVILNSKFRFIARLEMSANEIFFICIFYSCLFNNFKINKNNWIHFTKWEHDINDINTESQKKTRMNFTCLFHSQCSTFNFEIMYFWRMARDVFFEWTESHHINELLCFHLNLWREKKVRDTNSAFVN